MKEMDFETGNMLPGNGEIMAGFSIPFFTGIIEQRFYLALRKDTEFINSVNQQDGTSQPERYIYILDKYPALEEEILRIFKIFSHDILKTDYNECITTSWLTCNNKGDYIPSHNHDNQQWSGTLYYDIDYRKAAHLFFENPIPRMFVYKTPPERTGTPFFDDFAIRPCNGMLCFFPAFLKHYTYSHEDDKPRHSLAFNIIPQSITGKSDSNLDLKRICQK